MTRALLAAAAVLGITLAGPALAGGTTVGNATVDPDEKHVCVFTDSDNGVGYCVYTYGVHLPQVPRLP